MTQMEHFLCLLWGCLIGHFIVYGWCRFWDFITRKRVEIPDIKYDVTDNPILTLKNRLGQAYVATYDRTAKKLLHRLLEYVEWIDNWHNEQVLLVENDRNGYKRKAERLQTEFEAECSKNAELTKQLKDAELKNEQLRQMLKLNIGKPFFTPQDWQNTYGKEPIPVGTVKAEEALKRAIDMQTSAIIHMDSEDLNRYSTERGPDGKLLGGEPLINNEELVEKLRNFWGLEAQKAVEIAMPDTDQKKQVNGCVHKWKATLYDMKENETIEKDLLGTDIEDALSTIDRVRYGVVGYRRLW